MKQSPFSGGMTTQDTITTVEIHDNAYEIIPGFGWDWPNEALLANFIEQADRAEMAQRLEQTEQPVEINFEYATLYFGS